MGASGSGGAAGHEEPIQIARREARLIPGWEQLSSSVTVEPLGGTSNTVFKLTSSVDSQAYCVRVLRPGKDWNLEKATKRLATAGLTPAVVGASNAVLVQRFIPGRKPHGLRIEERFATDRGSVERLARFVGKLHSIPLERSEKLAKRDLRGIARLAQAKSTVSVNICAEVDALEKELPQHFSDLVLTHGDLHYGNMIESSGRLWAVDLEGVGARNPASDISYMFIHASIGGEVREYPAMAARRQFAEIYLAERGKPNERIVVDDFLFSIELEWPYQACWLGCIFVLMGPFFQPSAEQLLTQLPHVRRALACAKSDLQWRQVVIERGASQIARDASAGSLSLPASPTTSTLSGSGFRLGNEKLCATTLTPEAGSVEIDSEKPIMKLQVRLPDGSRKVQEFNESHTVGDLRHFCSQCSSGQPVKILSGFPLQESNNDGFTLVEAGLRNAAVTVKLA